MTVSVFTFFDDFTVQAASGTHANILNTSTDTLKVFLTNTLPVTGTHATYGTGVAPDLDDLAAGAGYTKGGTDVVNTTSGEVSGVITVGSATEIVFTATADSIGPFQYAVLYNDTATNKNLIGWWADTAAITLNNTETYTVDFGASLFTFGA